MLQNKDSYRYKGKYCRLVNLVGTPTIPLLKYIFMFLLGKLCRSEHGAAVLEVPTSLELQPSPEPIAVRESETNLSSLQEQTSEVSFLLSIFAWLG